MNLAKYVRLLVALPLMLALGACGGDDDPVDAAVEFDSINVLPDAATFDGATFDGATFDAVGADASSVLGFMDDCVLADDMCDDSLVPPLLCWDFPSKGPHCTHSCDGDEDCEAPSPGCSGQLVCRAP